MKSLLKEILIAGFILLGASYMLASSDAFAAETGVARADIWTPNPAGSRENDIEISNVLCDCAQDIAGQTGQDPNSSSVVSQCKRLVGNGSYTGNAFGSSSRH